MTCRRCSKTTISVMKRILELLLREFQDKGLKNSLEHGMIFSKNGQIKKENPLTTYLQACQLILPLTKCKLPPSMRWVRTTQTCSSLRTSSSSRQERISSILSLPSLTIISNGGVSLDQEISFTSNFRVPRNQSEHLLKPLKRTNSITVFLSFQISPVCVCYFLAL